MSAKYPIERICKNHAIESLPALQPVMLEIIQQVIILLLQFLRQLIHNRVDLGLRRRLSWRVHPVIPAIPFRPDIARCAIYDLLESIFKFIFLLLWGCHIIPFIFAGRSHFWVDFHLYPIDLRPDRDFE
jgi:hypothetical protein